MSGEVDIEDLATLPMTLPSDEGISDAIDRFQTANQELALVTEDDEIVCLQASTDAFEEVIGDLEDPIDERIGRARREAAPTGT